MHKPICLRFVLSSHTWSEECITCICFLFLCLLVCLKPVKEVLAAWKPCQLTQRTDVHMMHRYKALFHHCHGNPSQSYFCEATSKFNDSLHFREYLVFYFFSVVKIFLLIRRQQFWNVYHVCNISTVTKHTQENISCRK